MSAAARRTRRPPRFYFSLRSPYSWLAYRDLLEHHPRTAAALEWVPFFEPDELSEKMLAKAGGAFPYTPMSAEKHRYILQDVRRLAAGRGLSFTWPVDRDPVWEVPHLGYLAAARHGRGPEYIALAARARWELGQDVCDRRTIAGFGAALGLDGEELACASDDPGLRAEGVRVLLDIQRDGVFGVPFFVDHYDKYWGVDRLPAFVAALTARDPRLASDSRPAPDLPPAKTPPPVTDLPLVSGPSEPAPLDGAEVRVDDGHAGGCG